jgi:hypothetical protein
MLITTQPKPYQAANCAECDCGGALRTLAFLARIVA